MSGSVCAGSTEVLAGTARGPDGAGHATAQNSEGTDTALIRRGSGPQPYGAVEVGVGADAVLTSRLWSVPGSTDSGSRTPGWAAQIFPGDLPAGDKKSCPRNTATTRGVHSGLGPAPPHAGGAGGARGCCAPRPSCTPARTVSLLSGGPSHLL